MAPLSCLSVELKNGSYQDGWRERRKAQLGAKLSLSQQRLSRIRDCRHGVNYSHDVSDALLQTVTRRVERTRAYILFIIPILQIPNTSSITLET